MSILSSLQPVSIPAEDEALRDALAQARRLLRDAEEGHARALARAARRWEKERAALETQMTGLVQEIGAAKHRAVELGPGASAAAGAQTPAHEVMGAVVEQRLRGIGKAGHNVFADLAFSRLFAGCRIHRPEIGRAHV